MTYMVSTIVLALVDNMGAIIWENNFLMPHEFCLWVDLSAGAGADVGRGQQLAMREEGGRGEPEGEFVKSGLFK